MKAISYRHSLAHVPISGLIPSHYRSTHFSDELILQYRELMKFFQPVGLFDRTGNLPHFLDIKNVSPVPQVGTFNKKFSDVALERAASLISTGRRLILFWSGGIDSTAALVSLLKCGIPNDQLFVHLTHNSILEYEKFYFNFVKELPHKVSAHAGVKSLVSLRPEELVITGEFGDQIFGTSKFRDYFMTDLVQPYRSGIPDQVVSILEPLISKAPIPINSTLEYLWYVNFTMKWQEVKIRFLTKLRSTTVDRASHVSHFFDSDDFQRWALANVDKKMKKTMNTYKWPAKEFIRDFTKDEYYNVHKVKLDSLRGSVDLPWDFVLEDMSTIKVFDENRLNSSLP